ncbi:hypothetical protein PHYPSEUDO_005083 [Phytophthora pseudosyringae]|uniref:Uncharacterized protein n=1 Tax=Phytophthora pseudosyringae TaxID=221518 RepID=A0A8T1VM76_9STRA|nr:hypothetical protein PHYPSEUDO_005083 [Phytophthora pseudosyringae]
MDTTVSIWTVGKQQHGHQWHSEQRQEQVAGLLFRLAKAYVDLGRKINWSREYKGMASIGRTNISFVAG